VGARAQQAAGVLTGLVEALLQRGKAPLVHVGARAQQATGLLAGLVEALLQRGDHFVTGRPVVTYSAAA
jgi:hypothetical protein